MTSLKGITLENAFGDEYFIDIENLESLNIFGISEGAYLENGSLINFKSIESFYATIKDKNMVEPSLLEDKSLHSVYLHHESGDVSHYQLRWEHITENEYVNPCLQIVSDVTGRGVNIFVTSLEEK